MRTSSRTYNKFYAGFDLSLTASGIIIMDSNCTVVCREIIKPKVEGAERLDFIQNRIRTLLSPFEIYHVCIEGYAYGTTHGREKLGELGGVIRLLLYRLAIAYSEIQPTAVKKFATGSGGGAKGSKDQVTMHVFKNWGFEALDNNEADAYVLCRIALALHNNCGTIKAFQRDTIEAIKNPPKKKKTKEYD